MLFMTDTGPVVKFHGSGVVSGLKDSDSEYRQYGLSGSLP